MQSKKKFSTFFSQNTSVFCDTKSGRPNKTDQTTEGNSQVQPLEMFYKKGVPKSFAKFTGKHLC